MSGLPLLSSHNLLLGMERIEDAGIYRLSDDTALVQTVDFFTPVVDDPYTFGQIAVANSLSDIYAVGAKPLTAMNLVCFPVQTMDISVLREILKGGIDKMREAGVVLVGGHSVDDQEIKYGLSVTGTVHPDRFLCKEGSKIGDRLILTKPLGTGIISTAVKGEMADKKYVEPAVKSMCALNAAAAGIMLEIGVNACTDITGFGLIGHASEMIENTEKGMEIYAESVPVLPGARELAEQGMVPGGLYRNRDYRKATTLLSPDLDQYLADILFDPQTSGGLLISVSAVKSARLLESLHEAGISQAAEIGKIVDSHPGSIKVKSGRPD